MRAQEVVEARLAGGNTAPQLEYVAAEAAAQFLLDKSTEPPEFKLSHARDHWLAAWLAAACARPLDIEETVTLTRAMADSGAVIDTSALPHPVVDKHSTGGVGDKTTLVLLPMLAAAGLTCLKMSGKGLGHTGGTIDKLASVPGFSSDLGPDQMVRSCLKCGIALAAQTEHLAPADGKLYQLRDATGTVASLPLIVASILSKKLAGGAQLIGLDVKAGGGGILGSDDAAFELAEALVEVGRRLGLHIHASVTDMASPLGRMVGNALEVKEAAAVLRGGGDGRLRELCVSLADQTLRAAGLGAESAKSLEDGSALRRAELWFESQGGDPSVLHHDEWCSAGLVTVLESPVEGVVQAVRARPVGMAAVLLGAGRAQKGDIIDPSVGIEVLVQPGGSVAVGQPVFAVHSRIPIEREVTELLRGAVVVATAPPPVRSVVLRRIGTA